MATTPFGTNDAETVKLWSRKLFRESLNQLSFAPFIGSDSNSVIQVLDDTSKGPGDKITTILRMQLAGLGVTGDSTLEGNEERLTTYTDSVVIDQVRHAIRGGGRMSEQRVPFSIRNEARLGLQDWFADLWDTAIINQLAGNTAATGAQTGNNTVTAPDSAHNVIANGETTEATLTAADTLTLDMIDAVVETAETGSVPIRPIMVGNEPYYLLFLHPFQATDLRTNTATGQWLDIQKAAMQGGRVDSNPIFTGALGVYNQVILHKNTRIPASPNNASVRRAIFAGAQAATMAFGRDNGPNQMTWVEEVFDYQNQPGISAGAIFGVKRTIFNSASFGSIVLSTWAAAHTG